MKEGAWAPDELDPDAEDPQDPPPEDEPEEEINPEELVKEIPIEGTEDELFNRICTHIDPFYPKQNDDENVRNEEQTWADPKDEKEYVIEPVPWGEYG